ncbi:MAG: hypothetical protein GX575_24445 [Candidatus Anammoximicrobium sp.]|nr:hypothetical protein [Candidatus Anammoximicrobium sp.]
MLANRMLITLAVLSCAAPLAAWATVLVGRAVLAERQETDPRGAERRASGEPDAPSKDSLTDACRELAVRLPQRLDRPCRSIVCAPFVLAGDLSEAELQAKFVETVQPACDALRAACFRRLPDRPVTVLMFATEAAYRHAAEQLFFDRRVSRFGYYKPARRTVLVNLAEGDGGLLHELTHVLLDADFPDAPRWLQEGMATLHEACDLCSCENRPAPPQPANSPAVAEVGQVPRWVPRHNWRRAVLSRAAAERRLPGVRHLVTESRFRGPGEALDFAHARYFCWFLHDRGKLRPLYVKLRERSAADPTGAMTLCETLGNQEWQAIDRDFRIWLDGRR